MAANDFSGRIKSVRTFKRKGKRVTKFTLKKDDRPVFLSENQILSATGATDPKVLIGCKLEGCFYVKDEPLRSDKSLTANDDDSIVKDFEFTDSNSLNAMRKAGVFKAPFYLPEDDDED